MQNTRESRVIFQLPQIREAGNYLSYDNRRGDLSQRDAMSAQSFTMNSIARNFAITLNGADCELLQSIWFELEGELDDSMHCVNQWICNFETGASGNHHLQMHVDCSEAIRPTGLIAAFPCIDGAHFEPCRDLAASRKYCRELDGDKDGDVWWHQEWKKPGYVERGVAAEKPANAAGLLAMRCRDMAVAGDSWVNIRRIFAMENPLVFMRSAKQLEEVYKAVSAPTALVNVVLRPWQRMVEGLLSTVPNGRTVYWIYDKDGDNGKSFMCDYLVRNHGAIVLDGKTTDMFYAYEGQKVVCMDIARGQSENMAHLHVAAEKLASGVVFNAKYESKVKVYDQKPHIFIFANVRHDTSLWTAGRCVEIDLPAWILADAAGPALAVAQAQAVRFM